MKPMYKVEYLILFDSQKSKCNTVSALKNLLKSDSTITIEGQNIVQNRFKAKLEIKKGTNKENSHSFFNIVLQCTVESEVESFSSVLRSVRTALNMISETVYVIWDDISLYYSQKAYPILFDIENVMRMLITKFMLTNVGLGWTKDRVPTDVERSVNIANKDLNYLNNVDFVQLNNFLFSENFPTHKETLIRQLKTVKEPSADDIEKLKALLPESNWDRFFEPLVGCEADMLKNRWDRLYELRCLVAHNKNFTKADLEDVTKISGELRPILTKATESLDKITVTEEEKETVVENVIESQDLTFRKFLSRYKRLDRLVGQVVRAKQLETGSSLKRLPISRASRILREHQVIDHVQYDQIRSAYSLRNSLIYEDSKLSARRILESQENVETLCVILEDVLKE